MQYISIHITFLCYRKSDAKFEIKKFERLTCCLHSIITASVPSEISDNPMRQKDLAKITVSLLESHFQRRTTYVDTYEKAMGVYNSLNTLLSSKTEYCKRLAKLLTAELSLLTGSLFAVAMSDMNPVDHVERYRLKVQYIEEDIQMFEALLATFYFDGLVTGAITDTRDIEKPSQVAREYYSIGDNKAALKKVHPYCGILMNLKEETADKIRKYALGNTFRPEEPSYSSFAKVKFYQYAIYIGYIRTSHIVVCY